MSSMRQNERKTMDNTNAAAKAAPWEKNIRKVVPYVAGEQPKNQNVIKLNTNECPYPPAPGVKAVLNGFDHDILRKYPDPNVSDLVDIHHRCLLEWVRMTFLQ